MARKEMFSLFDSKAGIFNQPIFAVSEGVCLRALRSYLSSGVGDDPVRYATDFTLFHLGAFDDESGKFELSAAPRSIVNCAVLQAQGAPVEASEDSENA